MRHPVDLEQVEASASDSPGRTDAEAVHLASLVRRIPTLDDHAEGLRLFLRRIELELLPLDNAFFQRDGILLVLALEIVVPNGFANAAISFGGIPLRMKRFARGAPEPLSAE